MGLYIISEVIKCINGRMFIPNYALEIAKGGEKLSIFSNNPLIQALLSGLTDSLRITFPPYLTNQPPNAMHWK